MKVNEEVRGKKKQKWKFVMDVESKIVEWRESRDESRDFERFYILKLLSKYLIEIEW